MFYFFKYSLQDHKAIIENDGEWLPSSPVGKYLKKKKKKICGFHRGECIFLCQLGFPGIIDCSWRKFI